MEKYQFTIIVQFFEKSTFMTPFSPSSMDKMVSLRPSFFYPIQISLLLTHHLWSLAVLGGLGSNGSYQTIILTYMLLFIDLY